MLLSTLPRVLFITRIVTYIEKEETQYPLMRHYVQHVASLRIDNGQSMDSVRDQRVYSFEEGCIWADTS